MRRTLFLIVLAAAAVAAASVALQRRTTDPSETDLLRRKYRTRETASVNHAKFTQLQRRFARPQEVTRACISCHNGRAREVMKSSHWNWEREEYIPGRGIRYIGKKNILNNFCIGTAGSHQSCNKCHIGYGWSDDKPFDFADSLNVDCLACHDNSNTYIKASGGAGLPDPSVNLTLVAQSVGLPTRTTCGTCHFFGGGGNNVKHGDLDAAMFATTRTVDVHMGIDGGNMQCTDCHTARKHQMKGKMYSISSMNRNRVACEDCHGAMPHNDDILNEHTYRVACQSCHIPLIARVNPTKLRWDWSTAGKLRNGEPFEEKDSSGTDTYMSIKGSFVWAKNVRPAYAWSNGTASHYLLGDSIVSVPVMLNALHGDYADPDARIIPVKIHTALQPYDPVYRRIVQPKLFAARKGEGGYWQDFNWETSIREGMALVGEPYSGQRGFVETEMTWPVNHMVAPKEEAVRCAGCHTRNDSRLAGMNGFYMPGRDYSGALDTGGVTLIALTCAGVIVHGSARVISRRSRRRGKRA